MKTKIIQLLAMSALTVSGWAENSVLEIKVSPERDCVLRGRNSEVIFSVDLKGAVLKKNKHALPLNLAVVIDRSGSMEGKKLEQAKQAACLVLKQLAPTDVFSVVAYDDKVRVLVPAQRVEDKEKIRRKIMALEPGGSTALHAGVQEGARQVREFFGKNKVNRVVLLSDGVANVGPSEPSQLARLGRELGREGIPVTTVGLGDDYNEDLMVALAEASEANYYYVRDVEKLPGIFSEELGYLQNIVARDLKIIIQLPKGVEAAEVIGRPEVKFEKNSATLTVGEFYAAQNKNFLVRCRVAEAAKDRLEVARVQFNYRDEQSARNCEATLPVTVRFTDDRATADQSLNVSVGKQVAWFRNVEARQEAFALAEKGEVKKASQVLQQQALSNAALPAAVQDEKLMKDNAALNAMARQMDADGGLNNSSRKEFQYQNYQLKEQKR